MHRYKIIPPIFLILSLINLLLAAPVVIQEVRQARVDMADVPKDVIPVSGWDEHWHGGPPPAADQELVPYSPSPQTGSTSSPDGSHLSSGENHSPSVGPEPDPEGTTKLGDSQMVSTEGPFLWDPYDWSDREPKENFMSKIKSFFENLVYKCELCKF